MINPNLLLIKHTLKSSFNIVITIVNNRKEEREISFKKKRKDFMRENNSGNFRVILVDNYPPKDMETNVYYIKKNGRIVWAKMNERDFESANIGDF